MLQKLIIKNYAIIDYLAVEPDAHFNTVTGETGAGKSIILGALSLILGDRADTSVLINKNEKCVVEGYFDVSRNDAFRKAIEEESLDYETQCIIRREINTNGKSRAFVNDTPVTLTILNKLTSLLVDLHQQFDNLALDDDKFQLSVLDAIAQNTALCNTYSLAYERHKKIKQQLKENSDMQALWQKEADYKNFLLDELLQAAFKDEEIEQAEHQLKQIGHAERIINVLQTSRTMVADGDTAVINELKRTIQQLQNIADIMPAINPLLVRITSAWAELKDIAGELENIEGKVSLDPEVMNTLQERIDTGYKLLKKHNVKTTADLLLLQQKLQNELKSSLDLKDKIEQLAKEEKSLYEQLLKDAEKLSAKRKKAAPAFAGKVNDLLALVGMPNAKFEIRIEQALPAASGMDKVQFLLDANKSGQYQLLQKVASGGEMSRIMLCIKSLTAKALQLPTLIFDEVDTGISGEAARQVALLLRELSRYHQVICITHQPQVAARGTRHFYVYKEADKSGKFITQVKILQPGERVLAIARMIGGEEPSDAAIKNAKELVEV